MLKTCVFKYNLLLSHQNEKTMTLFEKNLYIVCFQVVLFQNLKMRAKHYLEQNEMIMAQKCFFQCFQHAKHQYAIMAEKTHISEKKYNNTNNVCFSVQLICFFTINMTKKMTIFDKTCILFVFRWFCFQNLKMHAKHYLEQNEMILERKSFFSAFSMLSTKMLYWHNKHKNAIIARKSYI